MRNIYSHSSKRVITDIANKASVSFRSPGRVFRFRFSSASVGDDEMERCCEMASKLRDDIFWWSFCEESHQD